MQDDNANPPSTIFSRPWRLIAQEPVRQTDPLRLSELAQELTCAINEQTQKNSQGWCD
jgi:hypothetical protein